MTVGGNAQQRLPVQVAYKEHALRTQLRASGAKWDPEVQAWQTQAAEIQHLGLANRVKLPEKK